MDLEDIFYNLLYFLGIAIIVLIFILGILSIFIHLASAREQIYKGPIMSDCQLVYGVPNATINILVHNRSVYTPSKIKAFTKFTYDRMKLYEPFKSYTIGAYIEKYEGACKDDSNDMRVMLKDLHGQAVAAGYPGCCGHAGGILLDPLTRRNRFAVNHEIGHAYGLRHDESNENFMGQYQGSYRYSPYQIEIMNRSINDF